MAFTLVVPLISIFVLLTVHLYILSFHRVRDLKDYRAISTTMLSTRVNDRCKVVISGGMRCLPSVVFIGASKCGTTSMVDYLNKHSKIKFVGRRIHQEDKHKEVHRFDRNTYGLAVKAIELADEWASCPLVADESYTVIHYTPHYIYAPTVPYELKRFYPHSENMKFIVMLREPVKRAWSSYWFKNSYLINGEDRGSVSEFLELARQEMLDRRVYEDCMEEKLRELEVHIILKSAYTALGKGTTNNSSSLSYLQKLILCLTKNEIRRGKDRKLSKQVMKEQYKCTVRGWDTPSGSAAPRNSIEELMKLATAQCFGTKLRSPSLGNRHIDKGVYVDQVLRWFVSFRPDQFHFTTLERFSQDPAAEILRLLHFMDVPAEDENSGVNPDNGTHKAYMQALQLNIRRLEKPNNRMPNFSAIPEQDLAELKSFYDPYNALLLNGINISV